MRRNFSEDEWDENEREGTIENDNDEPDLPEFQVDNNDREAWRMRKPLLMRCGRIIAQDITDVEFGNSFYFLKKVL